MASDSESAGEPTLPAGKDNHYGQSRIANR
jgi:hypothetical protein